MNTIINSINKLDKNFDNLENIDKTDKTDKIEKKQRGKSRSNNDECHELNNIKYKTMLLNGTNLVNIQTSDISNIDSILEKECKLSKLEPWCKLDKTEKISKLNIYIDELNNKHNLSIEEKTALSIYIDSCLDRKHLAKVKDVQYDKITGVIKSIPSLQFNNITRKFSLKKSDKYVSTTKSLGPKKKTIKNTGPSSVLEELIISQ